MLALTAFDPPGTTRDRESNAAANGQLWQDILRLPVAPALAWRSFGFDIKEGWREDGFCLAFDKAEADAGRTAVLSMARRHKQGAIFEYGYDESSETLHRWTLGCVKKKIERFLPSPIQCLASRMYHAPQKTYGR